LLKITIQEKHNIFTSNKDDLDSKGYTPEGNTVILDEHAAKSENEVNINEKTAEDNTKSGTQATSKKKT
jgi:hypothetical protein